MRQLRAHGYDTISFSNFADRHNAMWFMYGWTEFHTPNLKGGAETADEVNEKLLPWLEHNAERKDWVQQQMAKDHWVSDPLSGILRERGAPGA